MLVDRLRDIETRIEEACLRAGRARAEVTLVGVSKEQPEDLVREAIALGLRDLGENRVQALGVRQAAFPEEAYAEVRWHLIGPLQTNKVKLLVKRPPALLHTVDRVALVEVLDKELGKVGARLEVLVQVNIDDEGQKAGVAVDELHALCERVVASKCLVLRGLMAIPRALDEVGAVALAQTFEAMARHTEDMAPLITGRPILSLGMSDDFELAIAHGATHVRVGSALFGPRGALG
jgi:pyridoxal phosphate enzyme (YggS family)